MLRKALNELTLTVTIHGTSPLLVKDGREKQGRDPELPAMFFQNRLTWEELSQAVKHGPLSEIRPRMFVPGSSIRGAWRAHLEKTLRSLDETPKVCDPFLGIDPEDQSTEQKEAEQDRLDTSCSSRLANAEGSAPAHAYRDSCPVCQLFGNTAQGSRIAFGEGKVVGGLPAMVDNNAISRQTGAAISPFKSLVLLDGEIQCEIQVRNFELWQAGLLAHLFDDLQSGRVRLGSGKSKGWGRVTAEVSAMKLTYFGSRRWLGEGKLVGAGEMLAEDDAKQYGMTRNVAPPLPTHTVDCGSPMWRQPATISDPSSFWEACRPYFNEAMWDAVGPLTPRRERAS